MIFKKDVHLLMFNPGWTGTSPQSDQVRFSWYLQSSILQEESHPWFMDTLESYDQDRNYMCSFRLKNRMWLIGGPATHINSSPQRQFEVFIDHMEEKHTMPFKFRVRHDKTMTSDNDYDNTCQWQDKTMTTKILLSCRTLFEVGTRPLCKCWWWAGNGLWWSSRTTWVLVLWRWDRSLDKNSRYSWQPSPRRNGSIQ